MWFFSISKGERILKEWTRFLLLFFTVGAVVAILGTEITEARVASRFSLSAGEEYNDNIFFTNNKTHDFVTVITPGLHLMYQPQGPTATFFTADLTAPGEIYARNDNLTNIGDRLSLRTNLRYLLSRELTIIFTDCFGRVGASRISGIDSTRGGNFATSGSGTGFSGAGSPGQVSNLISSGGFSGSSSQSCGGLGLGGFGRAQPGSVLSPNEFIQSGETLGNNLQTSLTYLYSPNLSFRGVYTWNRLEFLDAGGYEQGHTIDVGARYSVWQQHRLRAGYRITFLRTRDGKNEVLQDFDVGDDFFTSRRIKLTPTLSILASTGLSMSTGQSKFRLAHKLDVALVKIWRTAFFTVGVRRGLGASYGVGGPAYTTSFYTRYIIQLSRRMAGFASAEYSLYDTQGSSNYETFQAAAGLQYWLTSWMSANLVYQFRRFDAKNPSDSDLLREAAVTGAIDGNSVVLSLTAYFDIWPNPGFGRRAALNSPLFSPADPLGIGGPTNSTPLPEPPAPAPASPANP